MDAQLMDSQLDEVISAILDGKYSWACVLWLQSRGYNPKDYIPCRTYNRLMRQQQKQDKRGNSTSSPNRPSNIVDLPYLKDSLKSSHSIQGGGCFGRFRTRQLNTFRLI